MRGWLRWAVGLSIATMIVTVPILHYRATYNYGKRLRVVTPGRFYRCGQLTADGFRDTIRLYGIKTVINLQDENPDPLLPKNYYQSKPTTPESEVCAQNGAKYVLIEFDLPMRKDAVVERPKAIADYLKILDDPNAYPILLHCKAGLHRTGLFTAIYRMEFERWPMAEAVRELKANGFGDSAATTANDYIYVYLETFRPRWAAAKNPPPCTPPEAGGGKDKALRAMGEERP